MEDDHSAGYGQAPRPRPAPRRPARPPQHPRALRCSPRGPRAESRSNAGTGVRLRVTEGTVEKHVRRILGSHRLQDDSDDHRRVLAVLASMESR